MQQKSLQDSKTLSEHLYIELSCYQMFSSKNSVLESKSLAFGLQIFISVAAEGAGTVTLPTKNAPHFIARRFGSMVSF
jgi:hypothetical protein